MTEYLKGEELDLTDAHRSLEKLLSRRQKFLEEYPHYGCIFFNTILQPPAHLSDAIHTMRKEFDEFHAECYRSLLQHLLLREGITADKALKYFSIFQEMFNGYFQREAAKGNNYQTLIEDHEGMLSGLLDIILYGIASPAGAPTAKERN